jgi:hypothetical protein
MRPVLGTEIVLRRPDGPVAKLSLGPSRMKSVSRNGDRAGMVDLARCSFSGEVYEMASSLARVAKCTRFSLSHIATQNCRRDICEIDDH